MLKRLLFLCMLTLAHVGVWAQGTTAHTDSLLRALSVAGEDTGKVQLLINIGRQYESAEIQKAKTYYKMAGDLSRKLHYPLGIIKYIVNYTYVLNVQGLYDSSLLLNLESVAIARRIKDSVYLGKTLFNAGTSYRQKDQYEAAVRCYEEGSSIFKRLGEEELITRGFDMLQLLYYNMHQYDKGVAYGEQAVAALRTMNDPVPLAFALNNLGLNYTRTGQAAKARACFYEAMAIGVSLNDVLLQLSENLNIGNAYLQAGVYEKVKWYYEKALVLALREQQQESVLLAYKGISLYYLGVRDYEKAKLYADSALAVADKYDYRMQRQGLYTHLSNLAYSMQDARTGEIWAARSARLADSILNESVTSHTQELEAQYRTQFQADKIKQLESDKKVQRLIIDRKNMLNSVLLITAIAVTAISTLLYRNYRHKQRLQQLRIMELETEKQLAATEAVLKGEEQERSRLARDLHDGLGGMLSGIKYSLHNMKGNLIMTPENAQAFERSMDMLDTSIKEMRRVAHNMMPEALVKFGLDTAVRDFCTEINQSGALRINYQSFGLADAVIDQSLSITIYRIVQELVSNILKHAAAGTAIVQLSKTDNLLSITVEDDGKGFDKAILENAKGIGWSNIANRVEFLQGKLDIHTAPGKGTSVFIEINV